MDFLVSSCEQHPMLRDGAVLRSSASAVTIGTKVGSFTKIRTSSKVIRIYLAGKALAISLKWGVNQLSRVRNREVTSI